MRGSLLVAAIVVVSFVALADDATSQRGFRIFPTNSFAQCVLDGRALEAFPPIARLKDAIGGQSGLATQTMAQSPLVKDIAFYAFAMMPAAAYNGQKTDEDDDDFSVVMLLGFSTNVTMTTLEEAVVSMSKSALADGKGARLGLETLAGNVMRVSVTNIAQKTVNGDVGDGPEAVFVALADSRLAVVASEERLARNVADDVCKGHAFRPEMPSGSPFFWLTATVDPVMLFGDDDDEETDDDDDEPTLLDSMPFLKELSRISASAEGVSGDESVVVSLSARFLNKQSAASAADMLGAMRGFASLARGGDGNALASLADRAKIEAIGSQCQVTIRFPREELQPLINAATPR